MGGGAGPGATPDEGLVLPVVLKTSTYLERAPRRRVSAERMEYMLLLVVVGAASGVGPGVPATVVEGCVVGTLAGTPPGVGCCIAMAPLS